jgi:magnesium transporter
VETLPIESPYDAGISWVRVIIDQEDELDEVIHYFNLDKLVELVWKNTNSFRSSLIEFEDSLFFDFIISSKLGEQINRLELAILLNDNRVITIEKSDGLLLTEFANQVESGRIVKATSTHFINYRILRFTLKSVESSIEAAGDSIDQMEDLVFSNSEDKLERLDLFSQNLTVNNLKRIVQPWPRLIEQYIDITENVNLKSLSKYLEELSNRAYRINSHASHLGERLQQLQNHRASIQNERMTRVMQVLTIVSTVFIPMTFLAGIYGMNFDNMPELSYKYSYPLFWLSILFIAIIMFVVFKKKKWI